MLDEAVGQNHGAQAQAPVVQQTRFQEELLDLRPEAADRAFLDGDQHLVLDREPADQVLVQRLGEAGIRDRGRQAARRQLVTRPQAFVQASAERQQRDRAAALAHDPALADLERPAAFRQGEADALAAG